MSTEANHKATVFVENDCLRVGRRGPLMSYANMFRIIHCEEPEEGINLEVLLCRSIRLGTEVADLLGFKAGLSIK